MKKFLLLSAFAATSLLYSCRDKECYVCTYAGEEQEVCSRWYSDKSIYKAELQEAIDNGWTCEQK